MIHGDFNEQNVIVRPDAGSSSGVSVVAVIDFGDSEHGPYVYELAIAIMYGMLQAGRHGQAVVDPLDVGGHLLAGYLSRRRTLSDVERAALKPCVAARFAQSLTLGAYTHSLDPGNDHVLVTARRGWSLLRELWENTTGEQLNARIDAVLASYGYTG